LAGQSHAYLPPILPSTTSATTAFSTLSLHDALPILIPQLADAEEVLTKIEREPGVSYTVLIPNEKGLERGLELCDDVGERLLVRDRKSTRLNSSHVKISYAVFCLKKKNKGQKDVDKH